MEVLVLGAMAGHQASILNPIVDLVVPVYTLGVAAFLLLLLQQRLTGGNDRELEAPSLLTASPRSAARKLGDSPLLVLEEEEEEEDEEDEGEGEEETVGGDDKSREAGVAGKVVDGEPETSPLLKTMPSRTRQVMMMRR
jgi:hypothetical protein